MLSCTQTSSNKLENLLHLVGWFIWIVWWCTDLKTLKLICLNFSYTVCISINSRDFCRKIFYGWNLIIPLPAYHSTWKPVMDIRPFRVRFVVVILALEQVFLQVLSLFPAVPHALSIISSTLCNIDDWRSYEIKLLLNLFAVLVI
jgi:hypothetical protein